MKLRTHRRNAGFTITEFTVSSAILLIVFGALLAGFIFGLRMFELTKGKLGATDDARKALARMSAEVRSANRVRIGTGTLNDFTEIGGNSLQEGNAIQIHPGTNLNQWVRYYHDPVAEKLARITDGQTAPEAIAAHVTNVVVFRAEDFRGNTLTNSQNNRGVAVDLQFSQTPFAPQYADHYRLRYKLTRRRIR